MRERMLLLDLGNTRLKFAIACGASIGPQRAIPWRDDRRLDSAPELRRAVEAVDGVRLVSVAAPAATRRLVAALRAHGLAVRQLRSDRFRAGVRNGYAEPWRLGADRWAAMLGARSLGADRAWLVVSAGTALTVDLLDAAGRHRGGVIAPGLHLARRALLGDTAGIARRAGQGAPRARRRAPEFARNTSDALDAGARAAAAGLIEHLRVEARRKLGHDPRVVITGGDAPTLASHLKCRYLHVPDLVLRGLLAAP